MGRCRVRLGRYFAVAATVLALSSCTGSHSTAGSAAKAASSRSITPSPSLDLDCGTGVCPTASAPTGLFAGRLLAYATHGFSAAELATITPHLTGPATSVWGSEQTISSDEPAYPLTPVATLLTDPASYAAAVGQPTLADQLSGGVVLAQTEAELRGLTTGATITMSSGQALPVTAVVPDQVLGGYEMGTSDQLVHPATTQPVTYLLVGGMTTTALTSLFRSRLPERSIRVRASTANGYLSSYDTVLTQLQVKRRFGEFSLKQGSGGALVPDSTWVDEWIRTEHIPQLGNVECNKAILPDLMAAMQEITSKGLGKLVNTADFVREGGCYNPRVTRFSDGGALSSHSWGIAVDLNVDVNPLGGKPHQDPQLVAIMAEHGFTWGGRWLRPDGAHFEWVGTALAH